MKGVKGVTSGLGGRGAFRRSSLGSMISNTIYHSPVNKYYMLVILSIFLFTIVFHH